MKSPIKLEYSESLIKESVRSYWWNQTGPTLFAVLTGLTIYCFYLLGVGNRSWYLGVIGATVLIGILIITSSYFVQLNRFLAKLRKMKHPEATLEVAESHFKVSSDLGSSEVKWSMVSKLVQLKKAWIIYFSPHDIMTLPIGNIPDETKDYMLSRMKENNTKLA